MNNYVDKDSLDLLFSEIEKSVQNKSFLTALMMALTVPDILGKLAFPRMKKVTERYVRWFDENVRNIPFGYLYSKNPLDMDETSPKMNGIVCYALRCKLFHEGINDIKDKKPMLINEFVLSLADEEYVMGEYAGKDYLFEQWDPETGKVPEINYLYISCKGLCREIVEAAKVFIKNNPNLDYPTLRVNNGGGKIDRFWFIR